MAAQAQEAPPAPASGTTPTARTVIVIDRDLPKGLAANAAAVLAHGFGSRVPGLVGLPVLGADAADLPALRSAAVERGLVVVDLPAAGQQTTDYHEFRAAVAEAQAAELRYLAVLVSGAPKTVRKLTGSLGLLR